MPLIQHCNHLSQAISRLRKLQPFHYGTLSGRIWEQISDPEIYREMIVEVRRGRYNEVNFLANYHVVSDGIEIACYTPMHTHIASLEQQRMQDRELDIRLCHRHLGQDIRFG